MAVDYVRASSQYHDEPLLDHRISGTQRATIACWFNADDTTASALVSLSTSGGTGRMQLATSGASQINAAAVSTGGAGNTATTSTTYSTGTWNHAAGVFRTSADRSSYLNGAGKATNTAGTVTGDPNRTVIAARITAGAYGAYFDGKMAHVAVWSTPLNDAEVMMLANGASPLSIRRASLVRYWPMEADGIDLVDAVLNRVAVVSGSPTQALYTGRNIIRPPKQSARIYTFGQPAAGGGSFIPSWAIAARGQIHGAGRGH